MLAPPHCYVRTQNVLIGLVMSRHSWCRKGRKLKWTLWQMLNATGKKKKSQTGCFNIKEEQQLNLASATTCGHTPVAPHHHHLLLHF